MLLLHWLLEIHKEPNWSLVLQTQPNSFNLMHLGIVSTVLLMAISRGFKPLYVETSRSREREKISLKPLKDFVIEEGH